MIWSIMHMFTWSPEFKVLDCLLTMSWWRSIDYELMKVIIQACSAHFSIKMHVFVLTIYRNVQKVFGFFNFYYIFQGRIQDFKLGVGAHLKNFVWKIMFLRQNIIFFPFLGGGRRVRPVGSAPVFHIKPNTFCTSV